MTSEVCAQDLERTHYCDADHPLVRQRAAELARRADGPEQLARETFLYVRDRIPFGFDLIRVRASETLAKGFGACFNKSLLLTALLRANCIPARFCTVPVDRWFMKPYIGLQCLLINHPFHHCLVQVRLGETWSLAEPTLDRATFEALYRPLGVDWGIEWSAERQDRLYRESLLGEPVVHRDVDLIIGRDVGNRLLPAPLARALCRNINRTAWRRVGITPAAAA